jgi:anti-sigma factor RsiW
VTDMSGHVEDRLLPLIAGELETAEQREVERHLTGCEACRAARVDFERLASALARPEPPPVHWGAYRAELREKLDARQTGRARGLAWSLRPLSMAVAAGLVAVMIWTGLPGLGGQGGPGDVALEDSILASRLDLISSLDLVQQLDLLEDLDVIGRLDGESREG